MGEGVSIEYHLEEKDLEKFSVFLHTMFSGGVSKDILIPLKEYGDKTKKGPLVDKVVENVLKLESQKRPSNGFIFNRRPLVPPQAVIARFIQSTKSE